MLSLKQALSLVSTKNLGSSWNPIDELDLLAWYQNKVGIDSIGTEVLAW